MRIAFLFILTLLAFQVSSPDCGVSPDSPFDSYGNLCFKDEKAHLDNFAIALQQNPRWIGYIVVYAGNESCVGEAKYRANRAKSLVIKRGIAADRIILKDGGYEEDVFTRLQPWPKDKPAYDFLPGRISVKDVKIFKRCRGRIYSPRKCPLT
jgi:hypothetical protein